MKNLYTSLYKFSNNMDFLTIQPYKLRNEYNILIMRIY